MGKGAQSSPLPWEPQIKGSGLGGEARNVGRGQQGPGIPSCSCPGAPAGKKPSKALRFTAGAGAHPPRTHDTG